MNLAPALGLAVSLVALAIGAELLVRGAVAVARRAGLSSFFIGLTIVGFGTSTPELAATLRAALDGRTDLGIGNVIGSNIMNIAVILGATAVLRPIHVRLGQVRREVWVVIAVAFAPLLALTAGQHLVRWHGAMLLAGLSVFLVWGYRRGRAEAAQTEAVAELLGDPPVPAGKRRLSLALAIPLVFTGLGVLVWASGLLVESASAIARGFGVSELAIGLTIVAAGTSAPELVTSLVAAARGQSDVAVGNVLGSNVFNVLGILGTSCVVVPQAVPARALWLDTPVMLVVSVALLPLLSTGSRLSRGEGVALLLGYAVYASALFALGGS
jgi:cation:H+ antiporter